MLEQKKNNYRKALVELNEIIKLLSKEELAKIPKQYINNIRKNMDNSYFFKYDENKRVEDQDFMIETKALIVEMYEKYLAPENEKEIWKKYDQYCLNKIEENKREKYSTDNLFESTKSKLNIKKEEIREETSIIEYKESVLKRFIEVIKKIFKRR